MPRTFAAALAFLALPGLANAQEPRRCISVAQNEAVTGYILPPLVSELARFCASHLGDDAYLPANAAALQQRLRPLAEAAWPAARTAVERISGSAIPADGVAGEVVRAAIAPAVASSVAAGFDANGCRVTDRLLAELAPLPAENLVGVMALFLEIGVADKDKAQFKVCR